jgi:FkbM family methyltransferase
MARLVGSTGLVCAFEPVPRIAAELRKNVQLNGFDNVCSVDAAVGNSKSLRRWSRGHHDGAGHLSVGADPTDLDILVQGVTIDSFVFESHNRPPGFIKIDVEGAESEVLAGAAKVLGAYHPTLLVDLHNPSEDVAVGSILKRFGYVANRTSDGSPVVDLLHGWPAADGLWGQVLAVPIDHDGPFGN